MHTLPPLLVDLAMVLGVAALTSLLCQKLHLPVVMGYLLAGLVVGPHVPIPLAADAANVKVLAELGVIFLLFSIGLEFNREKLRRSGPTAVVVGFIEVGALAILGYLAAQLLGYNRLESAFAGAALSISSTMIISKLFDERGERGPLRELVFAVLVTEDLLAILMLALLSGVAAAGSLSGSQTAFTLGRLALFLVALVGVGWLLVPRFIRWVDDLGRSESLLVASVGLCFTLALLAAHFGYSVALGAFIAGVLVAESGRAEQVDHLVLPLRDLFAAIFFVAVGMMIDPRVLPALWKPILVFSLLVVAAKLLAVSIGSALAGQPLRRALGAGLAMTQVGEFSFILVTVGVDLGAVRPTLLPVMVAVCVITSLATPALMNAGAPMARWVDGRFSPTFRSFSGAYRENLGLAPLGSQLRGQVRGIVVEALGLDVVLVGASLALDHGVGWIEAYSRIGHTLAAGIIGGSAALLILILLLGILQRTRILVDAILGPPPGEPSAVDRLRRRVLRLGLRLGVGLPVLALAQPFLPRLSLVALLGVLAVVALGLLRRDLGEVRESMVARYPWMRGPEEQDK